MNPFKDKITRATRHLALALLAGFVLTSCGGGGGSSGSQLPGGTNTGLVVIASGTVNPYGGTINDTLGETAVIAQPGSLSGNATITIERGRDAAGHVVTRLSSSSPTGIPVDIALPPADVVENDTAGSGAPLVAGLITAPFLEGDTKFSCPDKNGGVNTGWFRRCSNFWKSTDFLGIGNRIESDTVAVDILGMVDITYREASVLSSTCKFSQPSCYVGKQPVLFVNGYTPSTTILSASDNSFGGGVDTWGEFPSAMQPDYVPFEFRWVTAAKFQDVAADLGRAIDQIAERTGKKVHVIAHSFGGDLVRTYLQGLASGGYKYNNNVATLTTIGSPHSGIFNAVVTSKSLTSTINFPNGQDSLDFKLCQQLSCYQMGEGIDLVNWRDQFNIFSLAYTQDTAASVYGVATYPGEMAENLYKTRDMLPPVPIQVLIGLTTTRGSGSASVDGGDGLITYQGQRFLPTDGTKLTSGRYPTLHVSYPVGAASITEKILGFDGDVQPGEQNPFPVNQYFGYRHSPSGTVAPTIAIPMACIGGCNGAITTLGPKEHAAVVNAKNWIATWISNNPTVTAATVQKFMLNGTLTDNKTSLPVSGAYLSVSRDGVEMGSSFTNTTGAISLNLDFRPASDYVVKISKSGYVSTVNTIPTTNSLVPVVKAWTLNPEVGTVVPIIHTLNIIKSGDGIVVGGGITCSPVCKTSFKEGELVMLFAQADQGASFSGWSGCDNEYLTSFGPRCDITMSSDKVVAASFTLVTGATPVTTTPALSITTTSLPSATVGAGYAQGVAVSGGQTPYVWSVSSGLPSGLNINSTTGAIYGTPSASGTFSFTVTAKDSSSPQKMTSKALSITVTGTTTTPALSITTTAFNPATATVGVGYGAQAAIAATGGTTPYSCYASGLPSGMAMNASSCAVYGTPTVSGTFNVTVTVTDSSNPQNTASKVLSLTVSNPAVATPILSSISPSTITQGTGSQSVTITGSGFTSSSYHQYSVSGGSSWAWATVAPTIISSTSMTITVANTTLQTMSYRVCGTYGDTATCSTNKVDVTVQTAAATTPTAPSGLAALPASNFMSLAWNDNSSNETGFYVERKTGVSGSWSQIASTGQGIAAYLDYGVSAGVTYYYRVSAYNASGSSGYSNDTSVTITVADTTPPTINSFSVSPSSGTLGQSFTISYTVSDSGGSGLKQIGLWRANINGASNDSSWAQIGSAVSLSGNGPYSSAFYDAPPTVGNYWYGIHVIDNANPTVVVHESVPLSVTVTSSLIAPAVQSLAASLVTTTTAQMNGTINPNGLSTSAYFEYGTTTSYGSTTGPGTFSSTSALTINSGMAGLISNTTYHYRVVATNSGGTSRGGDVTFTTAAAAVTLVVNGVASSYIGTGQKTISLTGSGFNSLSQISWSCTNPNGTICTGSPYVWTPGTARWNNVTITSDTVASVYPTFLISTDSPGTYNWSVTFSGAGQSVIKYFTAIK